MNTKRDETWRKYLYLGAVILFWTSLYLYAPTLPNFIKERTSNLGMVGVILSMYGLWQMVFRLPLGIASDWSGQRRPYIMVGLLLCGLGAWLLGTSQSETGLLIGRSITGLSAATFVPLLVLYSQFYKPEEAIKATSVLTLISSVARMAATSVTGFLNDAGGYGLAFMLAALAGILGALLVIPTPESTLPPARRTWAEIWKLISRRDVLGPGLMNMLLQYVSYATTFGFLPILAKQLGAGNVLLSMLMSLYLLALTIGNLNSAVLMKRVGINTLLLISFVLTAAAILLAAFTSNFWLVVMAQVGAGFAMGTGNPLLMGLSIQNVEIRDRATAMGLHQAVYATGMFLGPWLSGMLADAAGIQPMFAVTAIGSLIFGVVGLRYLRIN